MRLLTWKSEIRKVEDKLRLAQMSNLIMNNKYDYKS